MNESIESIDVMVNTASGKNSTGSNITRHQHQRHHQHDEIDAPCPAFFGWRSERVSQKSPWHCIFFFTEGINRPQAFILATGSYRLSVLLFGCTMVLVGLCQKRSRAVGQLETMDALGYNPLLLNATLEYCFSFEYALVLYFLQYCHDQWHNSERGQFDIIRFVSLHRLPACLPVVCSFWLTTRQKLQLLMISQPTSLLAFFSHVF
jgi:hypothetical protein